MTAVPLGRPIAAVQGADGAAIRQLFAQVLEASWRPLRIAGAIEVPEGDDPAQCGPEVLRKIVGGTCYSLFQDLGPGSTACALDPASVTEAGAAVCRDLADGCDLVVLSKFGKLEAESGGGLLPVFVAAIEAGIPVLTSVSPHNLERWEAFAAPYYEVIGASLDQVAAWWAAQSAAAASSATT